MKPLLVWYDPRPDGWYGWMFRAGSGGGSLMDFVDSWVELREPTEPDEVPVVSLLDGRPRSVEEERSAVVSGSSGGWGMGGDVDTMLW